MSRLLMDCWGGNNIWRKISYVARVISQTLISTATKHNINNSAQIQQTSFLRSKLSSSRANRLDL